MTIELSDLLVSYNHSKIHGRSVCRKLLSRDTRELTLAGVVSQNGSRPHLLSLHGLAGAGLRAGGPRSPVTQHAVPGARHLAGHGIRRRRERAQALIHRLTWTRTRHLLPVWPFLSQWKGKKKKTKEENLFSSDRRGIGGRRINHCGLSLHWKHQGAIHSCDRC